MTDAPNHQTTKTHFGNLALLKAFAALLIVFHHFQQMSKISFDYFNFYGGKINFGYLVEMFFVISGFMAAKSYHTQQGNSIINFLKKRIIKIIPFSLFATIVTYTICIIYHCNTGNYIFDQNFSITQILTSLLLVNQGWLIEFFPAVNNPIWYLCVLMWLYIVYAILLQATNKHPKSQTIKNMIYFILIVSGILGLHFKWQLPFLHTTDCRGYNSFFLGVFLYENYYKNHRTFKALYCYIILLFLPFLYLLIKNQQICATIFFAVILLITTKVKQYNIKSINLLGVASFEVYLWHVPIFYILKLLADTNLFNMNYSFNDMLMYAIITECTAIYIYRKAAHKLSKPSIIRKKLIINGGRRICIMQTKQLFVMM